MLEKKKQQYKIMEMSHDPYFESLALGKAKKLEERVEYQSMFIVDKHGKDDLLNGKEVSDKLQFPERVRPYEFLQYKKVEILIEILFHLYYSLDRYSELNELCASLTDLIK